MPGHGQVLGTARHYWCSRAMVSGLLDHADERYTIIKYCSSPPWDRKDRATLRACNCDEGAVQGGRSAVQSGGEQPSSSTAMPQDSALPLLLTGVQPDRQREAKRQKHSGLPVAQEGDRLDNSSGIHTPKPASSSRDPLEAANILRKQYRIHVKGSNVPPPLKKFAEIKKKRRFYDRLLANTEDSGFATPTPIQRQVVPLLLHHREVLAVAPTGSGKTLAYLLPIIVCARLAALKGHQGVKALVMSPTRELAEQIARVLLRLVQGLHLSCCLLSSAAVVAGTDFSKDALRDTSIRLTVASGLQMDIAVATPLRLSKVAKRTDFAAVRHLILDEADKLLDEGLYKQTNRVIQACSHPRLIVALFSATLPETVEELACSMLRDPVRVTVGQRNAPASSVRQRLVYVGQESGKLLALRDALNNGLRPPVLVFVNSRQRASVLHRDLALEGIRVASTSADQTPAARTMAVDSFREGHIHVLVCTDLMARGIDFINVQTVINYDFPQSAVDYIHRIGRTGRAHRQGEAITLFEEKDAGQLRRIVNLMQSAGMEVPDWMRTLRKEKPHLKQLKHDKRKAAGAAATAGAATQLRLREHRRKGKTT